MNLPSILKRTKTKKTLMLFTASVLVLVLASWIVLRGEKSTPSEVMKGTSNKGDTSQGVVSNQQSSVPIKRYASKDGNLAFAYPSTWAITGFKRDGQATSFDELEKEGTFRFIANNESSDTNVYALDVRIGPSSKPTDIAGNYSNGTVRELSNGLTVWEQNQKIRNVNGEFEIKCPILQVVSNGKFEYKLKDGRILQVYGGYCWLGEKATTTYTYQEQKDSSQYKDALKILESIKLD